MNLTFAKKNVFVEVRVQLDGLEITEWSYRVLVRSNNIYFYETHYVRSRNKILHNVLKLTEKGKYQYQVGEIISFFIFYFIMEITTSSREVSIQFPKRENFISFNLLV